MVRSKRFAVILIAVTASALVAAGALAANADQVKRLRDTKRCPGCDLSGAQLAGAQLEGANLQNANLSKAMLYKVNFRNANLVGANLNEADLRGAQLKDALFINFAGATTDQTTECPNSAPGPCS